MPGEVSDKPNLYQNTNTDYSFFLQPRIVIDDPLMVNNNVGKSAFRFQEIKVSPPILTHLSFNDLLFFFHLEYLFACLQLSFYWMLLFLSFQITVTKHRLQSKPKFTTLKPACADRKYCFWAAVSTKLSPVLVSTSLYYLAKLRKPTNGVRICCSESLRIWYHGIIDCGIHSSSLFHSNWNKLDDATIITYIELALPSLNKTFRKQCCGHELLYSKQNSRP